MCDVYRDDGTAQSTIEGPATGYLTLLYPDYLLPALLAAPQHGREAMSLNAQLLTKRIQSAITGPIAEHLARTGWAAVDGLFGSPGVTSALRSEIVSLYRVSNTTALRDVQANRPAAAR